MTQIPQTIAETQRLSDGVLLRRFVQDADERAFAVIVERHAGLVMSVCRRVVGQSADCDDAFQATFYALSQRPDSIRECRSLTGWLYSVAWRTAVRLVRLRKRTKMETLPDQVQAGQSDPLERIAEANDLAALDEELNQLPDKYRHVLVMNYFAQQSSQEIADQLNESKGAIDGRIREGKRMLRVRLARRGVEIGVLAIATTLTQSASASVSPGLISSTTQLAKLSTGFGSMADVPGVDLVQMQVLSSTGASVMGIKAGTLLATGFLMLTGAFGISQLMARQDGTDPHTTSVAKAIETTPQDAAVGRLTGEIGAAIQRTANSEANDATQRQSDPFAAATTVSRSAPSSAPSKGSDPGGNGGKAEFSMATSRGVQQQLHQMIYSKPVPVEMIFTGATLVEILDRLEASINENSPHQVRFVLEDTEVPDLVVSELSIAKDSITIASAFDLIFKKVQNEELTWVVKDETILITTRQTAESEDYAFIRSYDVTELKPMFEEIADSSPSMSPYVSGGGMGSMGGGMGGMGGGGLFMVPQASMMVPQPAMGGLQEPVNSQGAESAGDFGSPGMGISDAEIAASPKATIPMFKSTWQRSLINEIQSLTPDCDWMDEGGAVGTMSVVGTRLIVRQSRRGHEKVVEVLEEMEQAIQQP